MDASPIQIADLAVLGILLISGVLALARGFVKEVLSIGAWIGASAASVEAYPLASPFIQAHVEQPLVADGIAAAAIFVATLVILWLLSSAIARRVQGSNVGTLDRSLGFLFGLLRAPVCAARAETG